MKLSNCEIRIEQGRIAELSDKNGISIKADDFKINYIEGATAYPGFVDSHGHIAGFGMRKLEADLSRASSFEECIEIVKHKAILRGDWLVGYGWNHENWTDKKPPSSQSLDYHFPDTPVFLLRVDGHAAVINSEASRLAKIELTRENPGGGVIERDIQGKATGILIDNAINMVSSLIPDYSFEQITRFIEFAVAELPKFGITEVHDMDVETIHVPIYQDLEFRGKLPLRISAYVRAQNNEWLRDSVIAYQGNMYSIRGLKYYSDGALGSRGAALLRHYEDDSGTDGVLLLDENTFRNRAKRGIFSGFDIAVHAIGDRAVRFSLDVFEKLRKDPLLKGRGKFRLEHSQIVHQDDLPRFAELGVTASVQPIHFAMDSLGMAQKRLGAKMKNAYLWQSFVGSGVRLIAGSDFPVESPCIIQGMRAFLHRMPFMQNQTIFEQEKLSLDDALKAYCVNPHFETGNEKQRGELIPGKQADITILSKPLEELEKNPNAEIKVLATIINGKLAYKAD